MTDSQKAEVVSLDPVEPLPVLPGCTCRQNISGETLYCPLCLRFETLQFRADRTAHNMNSLWQRTDSLERRFVELSQELISCRLAVKDAVKEMHFAFKEATGKTLPPTKTFEDAAKAEAADADECIEAEAAEAEEDPSARYCPHT
jgi:DNA anti-recombination protein RmuC